MVFQKKKKQYNKIIVLLLLCSLNIEFPDRSAFFASYNILTSHVSGYCLSLYCPCFHICISLNVTVIVVSCLMIAS